MFSWCEWGISLLVLTSSTCLAKTPLAVCTEHAAAPFDAGWCGDTWVNLTPLFQELSKFFWSQLRAIVRNHFFGQINEQTRSAIPEWSFKLVMEVMGITSSHLEYPSITIRKVDLSFSKKSMWILSQGFIGHFHGCNGAFGGNLLTDAQTWQPLTLWAMSASNPGHQRYSRA